MLRSSCRALVKSPTTHQKRLAESLEKELADHLVGDALENVVSALDGFGREICLQKGADIRFQNLSAARRKVQQIFAFDFADALGSGEWESACRVFQKRHVLAHLQDSVRIQGTANGDAGLAT